MGYDVEAAKSLLEDAGWTEGSDGIREKDGERLELDDLDRLGSNSRAVFC